VRSSGSDTIFFVEYEANHLDAQVYPRLVEQWLQQWQQWQWVQQPS
jgi:hypothetical protein